MTTEIKYSEVQMLPLYSQQALAHSKGWARKYTRERVGGKRAFNERDIGALACARLEYVLGYARRELAGKFCEADIVLLLNCYQGEVFFPDQFRSFASDLLDDLGLDVETYHQEPIACFVDKLRALTPAQRVALGDALEQTWYCGLPAGKGVADFFPELGIELAAD